MAIYEMPDGNRYEIYDPAEVDSLYKELSSKTNTSFTENLKIGIAEPLKTLSRAGAGLGSLVLPESGDNYLYGSSKAAQEGLDAWANPGKKEQTFGGKATSILNPVGMAGAIATLPFSPFSTTQQAIDAGESAGTAAGMGLTDTLGNVVGVAAPPFKGATIASKMLSGAAINAGQDVLGPTTAEPTIIFTIPLKNIGDAPFTMAPISNSNGLITYTSSNTEVATID